MPDIAKRCQQLVFFPLLVAKTGSEAELFLARWSSTVGLHWWRHSRAQPLFSRARAENSPTLWSSWPPTVGPPKKNCSKISWTKSKKHGKTKCKKKQDMWHQNALCRYHLITMAMCHCCFKWYKIDRWDFGPASRGCLLASFLLNDPVAGLGRSWNGQQKAIASDYHKVVTSHWFAIAQTTTKV